MPSLRGSFETVSGVASEAGAGGGEGRRRLPITVLLRMRDPGVTCEQVRSHGLCAGGRVRLQASGLPGGASERASASP